MNHNDFKTKHHSKIIEMGYWDKPREIGTLLMLIVTEVSKLYDENKLNKPEKLADICLRSYDYCGYYNIDLSELPDVDGIDLWDMISVITNEMEAYRVGFKTGIYIKQLILICFKYASINNIDLEYELNRKFNMLDDIRKIKPRKRV